MKKLLKSERKVTMEAKVSNVTFPAYKQKVNNKDDGRLLKNELSILLEDRQRHP